MVKEFGASRVEIWVEDEHRVGLKPIVKRVWAKRGSRPLARHQRGYKWLYVYGFCCPQTGENFCPLMPGVNLGQMQRVLDEFVKEYNPQGNKRILLVVDRAGWHGRNSLRLASGLELFYLPACSPELQPAEELWKFFDEVLANRVLADIEDVEARLFKRSCWLMEQKDLIRKETLFRWWPLVPSTNTRTL